LREVWSWGSKEYFELETKRQDLFRLLQQFIENENLFCSHDHTLATLCKHALLSPSKNTPPSGNALRHQHVLCASF
jgi:hypothetical protein